MRKVIAAGFAGIIALLAIVMLWPAPGSGLVLYSGLDYGPAVAAAFTAQTGIKIRVVRLATGSLLARITAQGHHPDWDLAWFDGATAAAALDDAGLLQRNLPAPQALTDIGQSLLSADGAYIPTGFTLAGVFISNPSRLAAPPSGWSGLSAADLHGQVGMNDPSISGPSFPLLAGMLAEAGGWPRGQWYLADLKLNGLQMFDKNDATLAALQARAIKLAIVQSSGALYFAAKHPEDRVTIPSPAFMLPNVMVEAAGEPLSRQQQAARFIAFVMRPEIQRLRQREGEADGYYWPVTGNVAALPGLPDVARLHVVNLDPVYWGRLENRINAWFAALMTGT